MKWWPAVGAVAVFAGGGVASEHVLQSTSLTSCQENSQFTASLLNIVYTPGNQSAYVHVIGVSSIEGYALFDITITVYGYSFFRRTVDPCQIGLPGLCPMVAAKTDSPPFLLPISESAASQIPGIAYTFPDLDAKVRVYVNMTSGGQAGRAAACLELAVSNGKTVALVGIQWASALVVLCALLAAAAISQLGHFNAAAHVVVQTLGLFSYFQAQAMIGLCSVSLPPIVQAWTQDFQWAMGLIEIDFMQSVLTWYLRATGGMPTNLFHSLASVSVSVQKRAVAAAARATSKRSVLLNRSGSYVVYGIQRAAFRAGIEPDNAYLTVLGFVVALLLAAALLVVLAKAAVELAVWRRWLDPRNEQTRDFRHGWRTVLKGTLFRCLLAAFPPLVLFSLYELTQRDSPAEMVDAVLLLLAVAAALAFGAYTVVRIASRSIRLHRNPAYILFANSNTLAKWGCFYVQFRASGYYFALPVLAHAAAKAAFIGLAQHSGTTQAVALVVLDAGALVAASVLRPWMDKSTNSFHITICVVNLLNALILLILSNVFGQPALANGVVGLVFWVLNAAVTLILLLMLIVTTAVIFFRNNPDARYHYMADDRTSFVKSQLHLSSINELDALAMTARGDSSLAFGQPPTTAATADGATTIRTRTSTPFLPGGGSAVSAAVAAAAAAGGGGGAGPRDRLLARDDETDSIVSDFRHPTTNAAATSPSWAAAAAQNDRQRRRAYGSRSPISFSDTPPPPPVSAGAASRSRSASRASSRDATGHASTSTVERDDAFARSPGTPGALQPMLSVDEHSEPSSPYAADGHGGFGRPTGSPAFGFAGSSDSHETTRSQTASPSPWKRGIGYEHGQ